MRRRITNLPEVEFRVNGKVAKLSLATVIQGRLTDRIFGLDLEAVTAAAEIETALPVMNGALTLSEGAWKRLEQSVRRPASAAYAPGYASTVRRMSVAIARAASVSSWSFTRPPTRTGCSV